MTKILGTLRQVKTRPVGNTVNIIRHSSPVGDGVTYSIFEFTNDDVTTANRSQFQLVHQVDKSVELYANAGAGWVRVARFEPNGKVTARRSLIIEQPDQTGNSKYELYQDPGTGQTDVLILRRTGTTVGAGADDAYTLLEIEAPHRTNAADPQEATLTLSRDVVNGSGVILYSEFLDLFNNWYPSGGAPSTDFGIRIQRRGTGSVFRDFALQYASSIDTVRDIIRVKPLAMDANGLLTDAETWFTFGRYILRGGTLMQFNDTNNSHYVRLKAPDDVTVNRTYTLPQNEPTESAVLETDASGNLRFRNGNTTVYKTAPYTATKADRTILCNFPTNGNITLPASAEIWNGYKLTVKRIFGDGVVSIVRSGTQVIDNAFLSYLLQSVGDSISLEFDGENWFITGQVKYASGGAEYTESSTGTSLSNVTWSGTAPTAISYRHRWTRVGNLTTGEIHGFGTAAQTSTGVAFDLPANFPTPDQWYTNQNVQFAVAVSFGTNANAPVNASRGVVVKTATGWRVDCACASTAIRYFAVTITYRSVVGTGNTSE